MPHLLQITMRPMPPIWLLLLHVAQGSTWSAAHHNEQDEHEMSRRRAGELLLLCARTYGSGHYHYTQSGPPQHL